MTRVVESRDFPESNQSPCDSRKARGELFLGVVEKNNNKLIILSIKIKRKKNVKLLTNNKTAATRFCLYK